MSKKHEPDLTEKVIGFRYWKPESGWLQSQGFGSFYWGRGLNEGKCKAHSGSLIFGNLSWSWGTTAVQEPATKKPHLVPANGCTCGLHAYHKPLPELIGNGPFSGEAMHIPGAIKAWGRMENGDWDV